MAIVMTAGNHDSGSRHEVFRTPWEQLNVYAIGQMEKTSPDNHIIEVFTEMSAGGVVARFGIERFRCRVNQVGDVIHLCLGGVFRR